MAKKQETKTEMEPTPQVVEQPKVETPVMEKPQPKRKDPAKEIINDWEIKDRRYVLRNGQTPLSYAIKNRGIFWFDREKGHEREVMFAENQQTPFIDEMKGDIRTGRIVFRNGVLFVPKNKVTLQKMLSIYHPLKDKLWYEIKPQAKAETDLDVLNIEVDAMVAARSMDIDLVEAIMRVELGSKVAQMTSKELKRDILVFAKRKPKLLLSLMNDENIHLRNMGIKSVEQNIINLSGDNRQFTWASTGRKLINVPFEDHPYTALAAWFKTDEGMEVLRSVEKQLA